MISEFDLKFKQVEKSYMNEDILWEHPEIAYPPKAKIENYYINLTPEDSLINKNILILPKKLKKDIRKTDNKIVWFIRN